jgi:flavodoxin
MRRRHRAEETTMADKSASKILVVFYSRSGITRQIAHDIARRCGADIEELHDVRSRNGLWGYLRSAREAIRKLPVEIRPPVKDARDYDVVVIGTPVWAGQVSSPVRAYVAGLTAPLKHTGFFCTMGGSGDQAVFTELARITNSSPLSAVALTDRDIARRRYDDRLDTFTHAIAQRMTAEPPKSEESFRLANVH